MKKSKLLVLLFVAALCMIINYEFSIKLGGIEFSLPVTPIAALVLIIICAVKSQGNYTKLIVYSSVSVGVGLVTGIITTLVLFSKIDLQEIIAKIEDLSSSIQNENSPELKELLNLVVDLLGTVKSLIMVELGASVVVEVFKLLTLKELFATAASYNTKDENLNLGCNRNIVFMAIGFGLIIVSSVFMIDQSLILINSMLPDITITPAFYAAIGLILLLTMIIFVGVFFLVFGMIRYLVRFNKIRKLVSEDELNEQVVEERSESDEF